MAHFRVCMEVAAGAAAEKRRYTLAITYDELCRKQWNQKATRGDRDFDVNIVSLVKDKDLLERARALYDASSAVSKGTAPCKLLSCPSYCMPVFAAKAVKTTPKQEHTKPAPAKQFGNSGGLCLPLACIAVASCAFWFALQVPKASLARALGPRARASRRTTTVGLRGTRRVTEAAGEARVRKVGGLIRRVLRQ